MGGVSAEKNLLHDGAWEISAWEGKLFRNIIFSSLEIIHKLSHKLKNVQQQPSGLSYYTLI